MSESSDEEIKDSTTLNETDADLAKAVPLTASQADGLISVDLGHLMAFGPRPVDSVALKKNSDEFLKNACL